MRIYSWVARDNAVKQIPPHHCTENKTKITPNASTTTTPGKPNRSRDPQVAAASYRGGREAGVLPTRWVYRRLPAVGRISWFAYMGMAKAGSVCTANNNNNNNNHGFLVIDGNGLE